MMTNPLHILGPLPDSKINQIGSSSKSLRLLRDILFKVSKRIRSWESHRKAKYFVAFFFAIVICWHWHLSTVHPFIFSFMRDISYNLKVVEINSWWLTVRHASFNFPFLSLLLSVHHWNLSSDSGEVHKSIPNGRPRAYTVDYTGNKKSHFPFNPLSWLFHRVITNPCNKALNSFQLRCKKIDNRAFNKFGQLIDASFRPIFST